MPEISTAFVTNGSGGGGGSPGGATRPRRYFSLGLLCAYTGGLTFLAGIILTVWGSSPFEPLYLWIVGLVLLCLGGLLFFLGIGSIGIYMRGQDERRKEELSYLPTTATATNLSSTTSAHHQYHHSQLQPLQPHIDLTELSRPSSRTRSGGGGPGSGHQYLMSSPPKRILEIDTDDTAHIHHAHWNLWRHSPLPLVVNSNQQQQQHQHGLINTHSPHHHH